jgi:hypothetical protein
MADIFKFSPQSLIAWMAAYAVLEPASFYIIPKVSKGQTTQEYYSKFPFAIVAFGDFIYSTFLLLVAQQVISLIFNMAPPKSIIQWLLRFATFTAVQWTGDLSYFSLISKLKPTTKYIDFFQRYGKDATLGAPIGDTVYGLAWFILAQLTLTYAPLWLQTAAIVLFMFGTLVVSY